MFAANAHGSMHEVLADSTAEIERLHAVLDKQPSPLLRVSGDGTLLAVSDAGLDLLGNRDLAAVLGSNFIDRVCGDAGGMWADFVHRVFEGGSGSAECEMDDPGGSRRTVVLLGVAFVNHPDGVPSLLVNVRDISIARRLEASLHEQEGVRRSVQTALDAATHTIHQLREQLEQSAAERHQLRAALDSSSGDRQRMGAALDRLTAALRSAIDAASAARQFLDKPSR